MHRILRAMASIAVFAAALVIVAPVASYSETVGQQRREERRNDRQGARETRQTGRQDARDAKQECLDGDEASRAKCRQEKRRMKQDARESARDVKQND
jgi:hypothetical protein